MMKKTAKLFIISGPSGVGKSTVIHRALQNFTDFYFSVSATTRCARPGEKEGIDYFFIGKEEFEKGIQNQQFLEYTCYCENYYGTPRKAVEEHLNLGYNVLLDIEIEGASQVKQHMPDSVTVFIVPPDLQELERRLRSRGTDSEDKIAGRLARAKKEFEKAPDYDYLIINDNVENASQEVTAIIQAEQFRYDCRKAVLEV